MPGYGAVLPPSPAREEKKEFFRVWEPETGRITFEISLAEVRLIDPMPSMEGAFHFFHHALFNPEGTRLFFLHRWVDKNMRRWTRMFTVAENGDDLYLFPMREMVSHITWASNSEVFTYARSPEHGDGYFLVEDRTGRMTPFFRPRLNSDGHPTMDKRRGYVITDTYPDRFRNQYLYLGDILTQSLKVLCRTHLPRQFRRELQVDLHPRLHPTRDVACFDSGHRGGRSLLTLDFSGAVSAPAG